MTTFIATLALVALLMAGMAIGVIFSDKELKGSCGGIAGICACENAGKPGACKDEPDERFKAPSQLLQL